MGITSAKGSILKVGDDTSPHLYAAISQVRSISGPSTKPKIVDITTHDSPGNSVRKLAVLIDYGQLGFDINFDSADASHAFDTGIWNDLTAMNKKSFQDIFPNANGYLVFTGYFTDHSFNQPVDNVLSAKISVDITDNIATHSGAPA
jgi:hypothetical protein